MKNQQKLPKQRLRLPRETIRDLQRSELAQVAGGSIIIGSGGQCTAPTAHNCVF